MLTTWYALVMSFGKIGLISMGGGNSMLKLLEFEAVNYRHWVGQEEFVKMLGSSFVFPGLTGIKLAALIGYKVAGFMGLLLAVLALNIPGLLLAVVGYQWLSANDSIVARKIMTAVQYGALALLAAATFSVGQSIVLMYFSWPLALLTFLFFIALALWNFSPFWGFFLFIGASYVLIK